MAIRGPAKAGSLPADIDDVLFDQGKMRVHATTTARYKGQDIRFVPLRDRRSKLEDLFQQVADKNGRIASETPIITRFSESNSNLHKPFKALLQRAGLLPRAKHFSRKCGLAAKRTG